MAIGIGGGSVLSRALGAKPEKAKFANQIMMTFFWRHFFAIGHFF
jgi:hypothetical protein